MVNQINNELKNMASIDFFADSRVKKHHVPLFSQQRHLRNIKCIAARNILLSGREDNHLDEFGFYFTLHNVINEEVVYRSEIIYNKNPSWRNFEGSSLPSSSASQIIVRLYYCVAPKESLTSTSSVCLISSSSHNSTTTQSGKVFIEWAIHLSGLLFVGEEMPNDNRFKENTLILGLMEGFYTSPDSLASDEMQIQQNLPRDQMTLTDEDSVLMRNSYCLNILYRIEMMQRVIGQTVASVNHTRAKLDEELKSMLDKSDLRCKVECMDMKVRILQNELLIEKEKLKTLNEIKVRNENDICEKGIDMMNGFQQLKRGKEKLADTKRKFDSCRERLVKTKAELMIRRKQLIGDLAKIYPLVPFPDGKGGFSICGVHLPHSEEYDGHDETMISVALGYVSHILVMLSKFLDVPLRYHINYFGSRSSVYDHINDKISENDRNFPLYTKSGKDKIHFKYGVFLMNKNIAQLRHYLGLATHDLRITLPNLYNLLQNKFRSIDDDNIDATSNSFTMSVSIPGHIDDFLRREIEFLKNDPEMSLNQPGPSTRSNSIHLRKFSTASNNSLHSVMNENKNITRSLDKGLNEIVIRNKIIYDDSNCSSVSSHGHLNSIPRHLINHHQVHIQHNFSEPDLDRFIIEKSKKLNHLKPTDNHRDCNQWPGTTDDEINNGLCASSSNSSPRINE